MDSLVPGIPVQLDRLRALRLDNRALLRAERELSTVWQRKLSILAVMLDPQALGLTDLTVLLWCGCLHEAPSLRLETVQEAVTLAQLPALLEALYAAWNAATATAEPVPEGTNGPLAQPSPGPGFGVEPVSISG